jgi:hypothetical protein
MAVNPFDRFNEMHMQQVWDLLATKFGFNVPEWKMRFREYKLAYHRKLLDTDAFLIFGNKVLNPLLNQILQRRQGYPTFNRMVKYVMGVKE